MKKVRIISLIALAIGIIITTDLGLNYFNSTFIEQHDGIVCSGLFARLFFGDNNWTIFGFYQAFSYSVIVTTLILFENIVLSIIAIATKRNQ